MAKPNIIFIAAVSGLISAAGHSQDVIPVLAVPTTKLESMETNVGSVIIKASTEVGTVSVNSGIVSVKCREITDTGTGRKERGIAIEVRQRDDFKERMAIDADEIGSVLKGLDYLNKLETSVTALNVFDAAYTSKGGLRVAAVGNRRTGSLQFTLRDIRTSMTPVIFSRTEMTQFCGFMDQAKKQLDALGQK